MFPPEVGLARINKDKNREVNRLDVESLQFHAKVREGYHLLLKQYPDRILMINAQNDIDIVHREVLNKILQFINAR